MGVYDTTTKCYKIYAYADGYARIEKLLTAKEKEFLQGIFDELEKNSDPYAPTFRIIEVK